MNTATGSAKCFLESVIDEAKKLTDETLEVILNEAIEEFAEDLEKSAEIAKTVGKSMSQHLDAILSAVNTFRDTLMKIAEMAEESATRYKATKLIVERGSSEHINADDNSNAPLREKEGSLKVLVKDGLFFKTYYVDRSRIKSW